VGENTPQVWTGDITGSILAGGESEEVTFALDCTRVSLSGLDDQVQVELDNVRIVPVEGD